ncbi:MAG: peptidase U32 family protein [Nanobdellota archaeon]
MVFKILAPIRSFQEAKELDKKGADLFYCGMVDQYVECNDRPNNSDFNFATWDELKKTRNAIPEKEMHLALNNSGIEPELAVRKAKKAKSIGLNGLIISSPLVLKRIAEEKIDISVFLSCVAGTLNSETIKFFKKFDINGVHLPRHLGISEIALIKKKNPDLNISVFGMGGYCVNIEAFCYLPSCGASECCKKYKPIAGEKDAAKNFKEPEYSCALCALQKLNKAGVDMIKIEGRELPLKEKKKRVELLKEAKDNIHLPSAKYYELCVNKFKEKYGIQCKENFCYY